MKKLLIALLTMLTVVTVAYAKKTSTNMLEYTIQYGDTLSAIALKYQTTIDKLIAKNHLQDSNAIKAGQILKIPYANSTKKQTKIKNSLSRKQSKKGLIKYIVKKGDTLFWIARRSKSTIKEIMTLNNIKAGNLIRIGQQLKIPKKSSFISHETNKKKEKSSTRKYKTKQGDTLYKIAKKYGISIKQLKAINSRLKKIRDPKSNLKPNMILALQKIKKNKTIKKSIKIRKTKISSKKSSNQRLIKTMELLSGKSSRPSNRNSKIIKTAKKFLGTRYVWGATGPNKFDCSGFTQYIIRKTNGITIPRVSRKQAYYGKYVRRSNLRIGDLVFFDTSRRRRGYVNHVGIYIGNNKFIHASSAKKRVIITSLNKPFYRARFKWGRRINKNLD